MTAVRRFSRSTATIAALYGASTGLGFLIGIVLARFLGAAGYGTYALAMAGATLAGTVFEFGLPVLAMREASAAQTDHAWGRLRGLMRWADGLFAGLAVLLLAGVLAWAWLGSVEPGSAAASLVLWSVLLVPVVAIGKLRSLLLLGLGQSFASQFPGMVLRPLLFLIGCGAVWLLTGHLQPASAMTVQVGAASAVLLITIAFLRWSGPAELRTAIPTKDTRGWIAQGLPMGLSESLRFLQPQLALLLIGILSTPFEAGLYRVADAIALVAATVTSIVGTAGAPLFGRLWAESDHEGLTRVSVISAWAMTIGTAVLGLPVALTGQWLFAMIFGGDFAGAHAAFVILWTGAIIAGSFGQTIWIANMTGQHLLATRAFMIIAGANLVLGIILIPTFGAIGGAIGTVAGTLLGTAWCAAGYYQRTGLNPTLFQPGAITIGREALRNGLARIIAIRRA